MTDTEVTTLVCCLCSPRGRGGYEVEEDVQEPVCGQSEPWDGADAGRRRRCCQSAAGERDRQSRRYPSHSEEGSDWSESLMVFCVLLYFVVMCMNVLYFQCLFILGYLPPEASFLFKLMDSLTNLSSVRTVLQMKILSSWWHSCRNLWFTKWTNWESVRPINLIEPLTVCNIKPNLPSFAQINELDV